MSTANNLPPEQTKLDREIVDELFNIIPEDWTAVVMTVEPAAEGQRISILNPDIAGAETEATPELRTSIAALAKLLANDGRRWEELIYAAHADEQGTWKLRISVPLPPVKTT